MLLWFWFFFNLLPLSAVASFFHNTHEVSIALLLLPVHSNTSVSAKIIHGKFKLHISNANANGFHIVHLKIMNFWFRNNIIYYLFDLMLLSAINSDSSLNFTIFLTYPAIFNWALETTAQWPSFSFILIVVVWRTCVTHFPSPASSKPSSRRWIFTFF